MAARPTTARILLLAALAFAAFPSAQADPRQALDGQECSGEVEVQHQLTNDHSCDGCRGSVVVQVGLTNRIDCQGSDCSGNVFVQVGLENSLDCRNGFATGMLAAAAEDGPCPRPLPEGNFYCHLLDRMLADELCLTLDWCLW